MNEQATYVINLKDRFSGPLGGLESKMSQFEGKVGGLSNSFKGLGGSIAGAFAGGLVAGGIATLVSGLKDIAVGAINVTREFTNMKEAISFASGDNAAKNIQFLDNEINRLGLDMQSTYKGFKTFQGALMGTSLEGEKGLEIFKAVSEAASVMKLSADQTEGTFLALGQMISKGNVQAEELRGQLGERLPGAFNIFARSLGVSTKELNRMLQNGEVIASETLPLFAAELRKTFSPGVLKAQDSFNANMNRFNNFILRSKLELGNGLIPLLNEIVTIIPKLDFSPLTSSFSQLGSQVSTLFSQFSQLMDLFGTSFSTFDALTVAIRYLSYIFRVAWSPIRGAIFLWTELVTIVKNSVGVFQGIGEIIKGAFTLDWDMVKSGAGRVKDSFGKLGDDMAKIAGDTWKKEKEGWQQIFAPIGGDQGASSTWDSSVSGGGKNKGTSVTGKTSSAGVEKIQAGTRNVTLNIQKLIGEITFERSDPQSESKMVDMVRKALLSAVNDVNIVPQ